MGKVEVISVKDERGKKSRIVLNELQAVVQI